MREALRSFGVLGAATADGLDPGRNRRRWAASLVLALILALSLVVSGSGPRPADAQTTPPAGKPGDLDRSFDGDGVVTTDFYGGDDGIADIVIQPDKKIVAVGNSLARYNPDGSLDTEFGGDGRSDRGPGGYPQAAALQPRDGKIVVAGYVVDFGDDVPVKFALARYNSDGSLDDGSPDDYSPDDSFGDDGFVTTPIPPHPDSYWYPNSAEAYSVAIQDDGKIVAAGTGKWRNNYGGWDNALMLVRYDPDGTLDDSFGSGGIVTHNVAGPIADEAAHKVMISGLGNILVVAQAPGENHCNGQDRFSLFRYDRYGILDESFGTAAHEPVGFGSEVECRLPDGTTAKAYNSQDVLSDAALQPRDGKIVAVGETNAKDRQGDFALVRYNSDGTLDNGFGSGGLVTTDFNSVGNGDGAQAVDIQDDGKIVVAGEGWKGENTVETNESMFVLARYNPDGGLDPSFGTGGMVRSDFWPGEGGGYFYSSSASAVAIQEDQKIVAAGGGRSDFLLARYLSSPPPPPPITDPVKDFAPVVYLHPREKYVPMAADEFIAQSELRFRLLKPSRTSTTCERKLKLIASRGSVSARLLGEAEVGYFHRWIPQGCVPGDARTYYSDEFTRPWDESHDRQGLSPQEGFNLDPNNAFARQTSLSSPQGQPVYYDYRPEQHFMVGVRLIVVTLPTDL